VGTSFRATNQSLFAAADVALSVSVLPGGQPAESLPDLAGPPLQIVAAAPPAGLHPQQQQPPLGANVSPALDVGRGRSASHPASLATAAALSHGYAAQGSASLAASAAATLVAEPAASHLTRQDAALNEGLVSLACALTIPAGVGTSDRATTHAMALVREARRLLANSYQVKKNLRLSNATNPDPSVPWVVTDLQRTFNPNPRPARY